MFRKEDLGPRKVGLKATFTVHLAPAASTLPQLCVPENCPGFLPDKLTPVIATAAVLTFVTMTDCAALLVLMRWLPKANALGARPPTLTSQSHATRLPLPAIHRPRRRPRLIPPGELRQVNATATRARLGIRRLFAEVGITFPVAAHQ